MNIYSNFTGKDEIDLNKHFRFQFNQVELDWMSQKENFISGQMRPCERSDFNASSDQWNLMRLGSYQCPKFNQHPYVVSGQWSSRLSKYVSFQLRTCH